jgi:hypothetical protein
MLLGLAQPCKFRLSEAFSLLRLAGHCRGLRSRWCQGGVKVESPVVALAHLPADRLAYTYRHLPRIGRIKLLNPTEEISLSRRARAGDHRARKKLVERGD